MKPLIFYSAPVLIGASYHDAHTCRHLIHYYYAPALGALILATHALQGVPRAYFLVFTGAACALLSLLHHIVTSAELLLLKTLQCPQLLRSFCG